MRNKRKKMVEKKKEKKKKRVPGSGPRQAYVSLSTPLKVNWSRSPLLAKRARMYR